MTQADHTSGTATRGYHPIPVRPASAAIWHSQRVTRWALSAGSARLATDPQAEKAKMLAGVAGELPSAITPPSLCRFRTRCPFAQDRCAEEEPLLRSFGPAHFAACHFPLISPAPEAAVTSSAVTAASTADGEQGKPA